AEDGIRGFHVTGVQTCALPIYSLLRLGRRPWLAQHRGAQARPRLERRLPRGRRLPNRARRFAQASKPTRVRAFVLRPLLFFLDRSEERRVGKEVRSRWEPDHGN